MRSAIEDVRHAEQHAPDPAGVGQRTEDVERRRRRPSPGGPGRRGARQGGTGGPGRTRSRSPRRSEPRRPGTARWPLRAPRAGPRRRSATRRRGCRACRPGRLAPAATSAARVETLMLWLRSPPVPTTSIGPFGQRPRAAGPGGRRPACCRASRSARRRIRPSSAAPRRRRRTGPAWPRPSSISSMAARAVPAGRSRPEMSWSEDRGPAAEIGQGRHRGRIRPSAGAGG